MSNLDLSKLKEEIDKNKSEKLDKANRLGENRVIPHTKDKLLRELATSLSTGTPSVITQKIKGVDRLSEAKMNLKKGVHVDLDTVKNDVMQHISEPAKPKAKPKQQAHNPDHNTNYYGQQQQQFNNYQPQPLNLNEGERDSRFEAEIQKRQMEYRQQYGKDMPQTYYAPQPPQQYNYPQPPQQGYPQVPVGNPNVGMLNEQVISERVQNIMNEQFVTLAQEALKDTIVEMYAQEKVKKAIEENKKLIKDIVIETIKELQERTKKAKSTN